MNPNYFLMRGVNSNTYDRFKIPAYLNTLLPANKDAHILDIGCGLGQTMKALNTKGFSNVEGIDICSHAVDACKNNGLNTTLASIDEFCRTTAKKYDFIVMNHVLEHLQKEKIIPTLTDVKNKLLAEKGTLFISVPNAQSNTGCYWAYEDFTHSTLFTTGSLIYVLKAAGFQTVKFSDIDCTTGLNFFKRSSRKTLLTLYKFYVWLGNIATASHFHDPSPKIFSYEIKVVAKSS